jgi:predicted nucleotidyltransferase
MVSDERAREVRELLTRVRRWASRRPDVRAVGLFGSWARGEARMDSDVDLLILTNDEQAYLHAASWTGELGGLRVVRTREWGPLNTEHRFVLPSGLEVEAGVAPPAWADPAAADPGRERAVSGGMRVLYDPYGLLERLARAHGAE